MNCGPVVKQRANEITILRAKALANCTFLPASWDKRFARDMARQANAETPVFSEKQIENINRLAWKYRRQISEKLVP